MPAAWRVDCTVGGGPSEPVQGLLHDLGATGTGQQGEVSSVRLKIEQTPFLDGLGVEGPRERKTAGICGCSCGRWRWNSGRWSGVREQSVEGRWARVWIGQM